jgi:hypothetical protein
MAVKVATRIVANDMGETAREFAVTTVPDPPVFKVELQVAPGAGVCSVHGISVHYSWAAGGGSVLKSPSGVQSMPPVDIPAGSSRRPGPWTALALKVPAPPHSVLDTWAKAQGAPPTNIEAVIQLLDADTRPISDSTGVPLELRLPVRLEG